VCGVFIEDCVFIFFFFLVWGGGGVFGCLRGGGGGGGGWSLFLCERFLLFQQIYTAAGHVSENVLSVDSSFNWLVVIEESISTETSEAMKQTEIRRESGQGL